MSIATEISHIESARNLIRNKLINWGISGITSSSLIDACATGIDSITNQGSLDTELGNGQSKTFEAGYYTGGTFTATTSSGTYNTSDATAAASDIYSGKTAYTADGKITGTMSVNPTTLKSLFDAMTETTKTFDRGYYAGITVTLDSTVEDALAAI